MAIPVIITPRRLGKSLKPFHDEEKLFWYNGSRGITEMMHAMSILFPEGEAFFVKAVIKFSNHPGVTQCPQLMKDVKAFASQESQHSAEHHSFNKEVGSRYGHNMEDITKFVKLMLTAPKYAPSYNEFTDLAVTCSLEHFTALFAELLLCSDRGKHMLDHIEPSHKSLWIWHAVEEMEHKAVAFDVYKAVGGGYFRRIYIHIFTTVVFLFAVFSIYFKFMNDGGHLFDFYEHFRVIYFIFVYPGFLGASVPIWLRYFRRDFHPWEDEVAAKEQKEIMKKWVTSLNDLKVINSSAAK